MADISHQIGSDLTVGPTGDLAIADGSNLGQQRVLRRLLTNAGDYIWQLTYGAGLARFVGETVDVARIRGAIRTQLVREHAVSPLPEPTIDVQSGGGGTVFVTVRYTDSATGSTQVLSFQLGDS